MVAFLDTGYHFAETIGTRDAVEATLPVNLINITPVQSVAEQDATYGKDLFDRDPDLCCALRKVKPLEDALSSYDGWPTGLRRDETRNRVIAPVIGWDDKKRKVKVSPLARWTAARRPLHRREQRPGDWAVRRLPVHRLLAVHPPRGAGRGPAQRLVLPASPVRAERPEVEASDVVRARHLVLVRVAHASSGTGDPGGSRPRGSSAARVRSSAP